MSANGQHEVAAEDGIISHSPQSMRVRSEGASVVQVEYGIGKTVLAAFWFSAFISGAALIGLLATCFFIYKSIGYTAVLEYDLIDLRAKVGEAHENTPAIEETEE